MEGKINKYGALEILRVSRYEVQQCPNKEDIGDCGGWCPQFGEPKKLRGFSNGLTLEGIPCSPVSPPENSRTITICQGRVLEFDNFTDERE